MGKLHRVVLLLLFVCLPSAAFAVVQSADIQITASDSPDPVAPDGNITYTVTVTNAGPDPATSATMSVVLNNTLLYQSITIPAGWSCPALSVGQGSGFTCSEATMGAGSAQFTVVLKAAKSQIGINDTTLNQLFTASSSANDPDGSNNSVTVQTAYDAPNVDMAVTGSDSPDPVYPDGNITYTVNVSNNGPDAATNASMSVFQNNTLLYESVTAPAGWTCPSLSVGYGGGFTCTTPTLAASSNVQFTVVLKAAYSQIGPFDQTLNQLFTVSSNDHDDNNGNNAVTVQTAYVTPDADIQITASDSPDPVAPDGNITYTITVTNAGPDPGTNTSMTVALNNTLLYQSITTPAGWSCPSLSVGHGASFSCTASSLAVGTSQFTLVLKAAKSQLGVNDQTLSETFSASSTVTDPNNGNNVATVQTAYDAPSVDLQITASDSPDPVAPDGNITYTVNVTNAGPDAASNAAMTVVLNNTLLYQSITVPAGWTCPSLSVGHGASFTCTAATMAASSSAQFTVVLKAAQSQLGINPQTLNETFTTSNEWSDPNNANNAVTVQTTYSVPVAELAVTNSDSPDPVFSGANITYTQTIINNGPDAAPNVSFTQTLPASVGFVSLSAPAGFTCTTPSAGGNGAINCVASSLANGAGGTFTLVVKVLALSGTVTDTVAASSGASDSNGANNSAQAITTINAPTTADLSITKTTNATNVARGDTISYSITLTNNGPHNATTVTMTDVLPASLLFQSISAPAGFSCTTPAVGATGTITCSATSLANGASAVFTLTVKVASNATGSITNSASAGGAQSDSTPGNSTSSASGLAVIASADVSVTKSTLATQAPVGGVITYTITASNAGPSSATNVVVTDNLPAGLQFISAVPSQGNCTGTTTITCNLGTLANAASATITLSARVIATSGTISNGASVVAVENDPSSGNNSGSTPGIPVVPALAQAENIPTLSEWALLALIALVGLVGFRKVH